MKGSPRWFGILLFLFSLSAFSQNGSPCFVQGSALVHEHSLQAQGRTERLSIPVVIHIVLPEGTKGPSESNILSQIDALNQNFQKYQSAHLVPKRFRSSIGIPDIEFCIASIDPEGDPHPGITRRTTSIPNIGQHIFSDGRQSVHHTVLDGQDAWDTDRYLNIWVAEIESFAARTNFPGAGRPDEDGIVIDPDFFGKVKETSSRFLEGRTLVHEIGHYLNLQHPWGNAGCNSDDGLDDTPFQDGPYFGCASPSTTMSCGSIDMIQNFMQFSDDPCLLYFTRDQVQMMRTILQSVRSGVVDNGLAQCSGVSKGPFEKIIIQYDANRFRIFISGLKKDENYRIRTFNMGGQLAHEFNVHDQYTAEIQSRFFPNGIYVVVVEGPTAIKRQKISVFRP